MRLKKPRTIPRHNTGGELDKQEAIRHLLHSAIRLIMIGEDSFAIHLIVQSATTLIRDVATQTKTTLAFEVKEFIHESYRDEWHDISVEIYNFLKHGFSDHDATVPIADIVGTNVLSLLLCVTNYNRLYERRTAHMTLYMAFATLLMPEILILDDVQKAFVEHASSAIGHMTPRVLLSAMYENMRTESPEVYAERQQDLKDNHSFYDNSIIAHISKTV